MRFKLICIGSLKEKYLKDAEAEYFKRISGYGSMTVTELRETRAETIVTVRTEGERILKALDSMKRNKHYIIALDSTGKDLSSEEFARTLSDIAGSGTSDVVFIIGGSFGLSDEVKKAADLILSFGRKTYPHQLMRIILAEQVYRTCKINAGETYHK